MSMVSAICKEKHRKQKVSFTASLCRSLFVVLSVPPPVYASPVHAGEPSPSAGPEHSAQLRSVGAGLVVVQAGLVVNVWAEL